MAHWDERYRSTTPVERSWTQDVPAESLDYVDEIGLTWSDPVIDVGGGASRFVDALVDRGFVDLTVLDLASSAIDEACARVADAHPDVPITWVCADVTTWEPTRTYRLWHDRAVFHFLVERAAREAYLDRLTRATAPGSWVILATFAPDGPPTCSGLPVARYDERELTEVLGPHFELARHDHRIHTTPWGATQPFTWALFRRRA